MTPSSLDADLAANPFFHVSHLPYQLPLFDQIADAHYLPAFAEAMRQHLAEVAAIADNRAAASFDNTIVAMERAGRMLVRVSKVFFNLNGTHTNDTLEAVAREMAPRLAAHRDAITLNGALFARIRHLFAQRAQLTLDAESTRLLERYYTDFKRAGASLSDADKETLKTFNAELATLSTRFSQNVLRELNAAAITVDHRAELDGLSDQELAVAAAAATAAGQPGKYVIALTNTTGQPLLSVLTNRALRERLHTVSVERGSRATDYDNRPVILRMVTLRAARAQLLGYPNHASYVLEDETARSTTAVNQLLADLAPAAVANARQEAVAIQAQIDAEHGDFPVAAHDWAFYSEKVRQQRYAFDQTQLRPYLELNSVLQNGVFFAAHRLYGLRFTERTDLPVYHPDVRVFDVTDANGQPLALFLADFYARPSKRGGAWMNEYVGQSRLFATLPVVGNHLNIPKPPAGEPTLMAFDDVITMFHEFGHALHGMLSNVQYPRFAGTSVPRDFVEFPSQVNEMWAVWPDVLTNYAKHYQTGEAMPQALLDKIIATQQFNQGFATTEYLAAALLDQHWHQLAAGAAPTDVFAFEAAALQQAGVNFAPVPPRYRSTYFSHVFAGGYAAGYYAYLWSEVLDADSADWFKENGGLSRRNGDWFRNQVLAHGGSVDAMTLFHAFRGRTPQIDALLARRGLKTSSQ